MVKTFLALSEVYCIWEDHTFFLSCTVLVPYISDVTFCLAFASDFSIINKMLLLVDR